jgi:putative membrane protein
MKYQTTMLPIAAALALALAAGCERRSSEDMSGSTRTTSATPSQMDDMARDAAARGAAGATGMSDRTGTMGTTGTGPGSTGTMGMNDTAGTTGTSDTTGATGTSATTGAKVEQPLDDHDKQFLTKAAEGSMEEVALATTVSQKATMPEVKSFADRMVSDHTKASDELKSLAAKKGVTLPNEMEKSQQNEADKLAKLTGKKVDKEYASYAVKDHEKDVKEFQKAAKDAKDPDIKAWAAKMVPILEDHLKTAKQLEPKIK